MMINLVRPKFFIPVHGDYRHLKRHAELAAATGVPEKVILLEDGDVLSLDREHAEKTARSPPAASASTTTPPPT